MANANFDMDKLESVYNNHYFNLVKTLQTTVGIWPYQSGYTSWIRRFAVCSAMFCVHIPFINGIRIWCGKNLDVCCENILAGFFVFVVLLKYVVTAASAKKLKKVYEQLAINWLTLTDSDEQAIIIEYAKLAKIKATVYLGYIIAGGFGFTHLPMVPVILDFIIPLNKTRDRILFIKAEYIIDPFEHYYSIYLYYLLVTSLSITLIAVVDTTYTIVAHQNLGALAVVTHRVMKATVDYDPTTNSDYKKIRHAVYLYKQVLQFAELIETSYSTLFLFIIICSILGLSTSAVVAISSIYNNIITDAVRTFLAVVGISVHLFYISWPGQILLDQSHNLFVSIYANQWYNISQRGKVLLKILMLRCIKPCMFTAGKLYVMNFENFGSILKTALTYVTAAVSFRN